MDVAHLATRRDHLLVFANQLSIEDELASPAPSASEILSYSAPSPCDAVPNPIHPKPYP